MDYQNLCSSAILYRLGRGPFSHLATLSVNKGTATCKHCLVTLTPSKLSVPSSTTSSSTVLVNLSGLFRSHCSAGKGWTCIWQFRSPSCYAVFEDVKELLKHLLFVHVRDEGDGRDWVVDWPGDGRRGDLRKCGFGVRIEGLEMAECDGRLVVLKRLVVMGARSEVELATSSGVESRTEIGSRERLSAAGLSRAMSSVSSLSVAEMDDFEGDFLGVQDIENNLQQQDFVERHEAAFDERLAATNEIHLPTRGVREVRATTANRAQPELDGRSREAFIERFEVHGASSWRRQELASNVSFELGSPDSMHNYELGSETRHEMDSSEPRRRDELAPNDVFELGTSEALPRYECA